MTDPNGRTDNPGIPDAPPELKNDLRALFGTAPSVPQLVDARILAAARRTMAAQRRRRFLLRTVSIGAAAAACIVAMVWLSGVPGRSPRQTADAPTANPGTVRATPGDVNGDGKVDILDALALARHIETGDPKGTSTELRSKKPDIVVARGDDRSVPGNATWDINGDGVIDRRDVDAVAYRAVSLNN